MKQGVTLLSAFGWLQLASAGCCRSNKCLQDITNPLFDGPQDCLSLLAVTITPEASTVTETVTEVPTMSWVETVVFTETVTSILVTETELQTVDITTTADTETVVVTVTKTIVATDTSLQTLTTTVAPASTRIYARAAETELSPSMPSYATANCPSWEKYVKACKCAGVTATTITAEGPSATTLTSTFTDTAAIISVPTTISIITTVVESAVTTVTDTETSTALVTDTVSSTLTVDTPSTVTITQTVVETVSPQASCKPGPQVFKAFALEAGTTPVYYIYANLLNGLTGGISWQGPSSSTAASVQNKYIWSIDQNGYLGLAYNVPPYTYSYTAYMSTASPGSNWPQVNTASSVDAQIAGGAAISKIKGCINSLTGELTLSVAGRKNILWCGQQMWMSAGLGEDINRGTCIQMFPKVISL
ncbi:uncharacterized protein PODANS_5_6710 [Podospora anserina S mat+]|uniref:Podospora anserina S mat+ genomic DNA chromosome 5, supercontig 8 n=1 Tax=Podospora anserina (strain S / ATCC MYA-4624 / DSM 980 / FGSC 10383) TaxID=515849 RepID=B2AM95_PODAN|nr:uncharacterized protein PODANS_5_6710 [Podospora anserina S mat+]CAP65083.1 unnamed protein product [Podospora anserina S mat+]CDP29826.1 Putative protein of unknown function [Podospora anserina S mat+]